ncbi:MAG: flippase-like domain-containing protein [bacterium]|nr:flippase-like domain-containing protein [bacterium]
MSVSPDHLEGTPLPRSAGAKRLGGLALKVLLTAVLLGTVFWQVRWSEITGNVSRMDTAGLLAAVLLWIPNLYLQYYRWKLTARRAGTEVLNEDIRASFWLGHTLGFATPGRIGAFGRALFLSNVPLGRAAALTVLERTYAALTVNGLGLVSLGILPYLGWHVTWATWSQTVSLLLIIAGSCIFLTGLIPGPLARLLQKVVGNRKWSHKVVSSLETIAEIPPRVAATYLTLAVLSLLVSLGQFVLILHALGAKVAVVAGMMAVLLNFVLKGNIPLTLGNLGVGEWTALLCLRGLGVEDAQAITASLTVFALNVALPAVIGLRYLRRVFALPKNWSTRPA